MSGKNEQHLNDLEEIIRLVADVWPNDRENVALAGAKFEDVIEGFSENVGQLQKLIDLAWQGLRHLYEKDAYFMRVKTATMMAVNSIREYVLNDGDLQVEDFERACSELDKALTGDGESADTVVELDEEVAEKVTNKEQQTTGSLDDAASLLMSIDEKRPQKEPIIQLNSLLKYLAQTEEVAVAEHIAKALKALDGSKGWLGKVSGHLEDAINEGSGDDWDQSEPDVTAEPASAAAGKVEKPADKPDEAHFIIPQDVEEGMVGEFVTECSDLIETAESSLLDLEERPNDDELINTIFRAFHTIKGTSAFMGFDPISEFTHSVETLLSMVREGDLPFDRTCADINLKSIDIIKKMLAVVETAGPGDPLPKPQGYNALMRVLHKICEEGATPSEEFEKERDEIYMETSVAEEATEEGGAETAMQPGSDGAQSSKSETESTVRVNVSRLDRLIDMVGELVIAHSVVAQDDAISRDAELLKKVNHTSKILRELQDTSLTLRMVPLKATFHKMNRLVRDLARKAGKKVKFSTVGEDTEIDRNMVDVINEPLVHMLRNALDHGIEEPEKRAKSDKAETANIWLRAFQEGGKVVIEIEDDGGGIDKDVILNKAIEKGLVDPEKKLTDSEIYRLIFLPGFSSKDQVTDLSGRGVGMDVVRRNIEQLQGKIEVT